MAERTRLLARVTLALAAFLGCLMMAASDDVPRESTAAVIDVLPTQLIAQPPGANWLSYNGDFTGRRFSSLSQINPANVGQLAGAMGIPFQQFQPAGGDAGGRERRHVRDFGE